MRKILHGLDFAENEKFERETKSKMCIQLNVKFY